MGCSDSRSDLSPQEERFYLGELELNYHKLESIKVDYVHRKYSHNNEINENQWLNINRRLDLSLNNPHSSFASTIKVYYDQYKKGQVYQMQKLLCLGLVLSQGTIDYKAKLLFEAFSFDGSKELERSKIGEIFDTFYKIFVKFGSKLLKDNPKVLVTSDEHDGFMKKMKAGKEDLREAMIHGIVGDGENVTLDGFIQWFEDPKNSDILSSTGFRKALRKETSHLKHKKNNKE